jgi:REP element-mobilizing transposase RayT
MLGVMARPMRIEFPGAIYHLTSRGNARMEVFQDDRDRTRFFLILEQAMERFNWHCHAYCLMDNHYHLIVETVDGNLSSGMRHLNGVYTQGFNRRHNRVGHVFQGRFKSILVERDTHLLELCRYVVLNPVRAGMVRDPGQYHWSSYRPTAGLSEKPVFLTVDWILGQFDEKRGEARKRYRRFVKAGMEEPSPWEMLKAQCILGEREFIEKISLMLKQKSELSEISKHERFAFRPPLGEVLGGMTERSKVERDMAIRVAYLEYGFTLTDIAKHLGLHYTTVSKIVNRPSS